MTTSSPGRRSVAIAASAAVAALSLVAASVPVGAIADDRGPGSSRTVQYRPSDANIPNPERGFDHETDTHYRGAGADWEPLTDAQLVEWRALGDTQLNRGVYLDAFAGGADISADFLARQQADFDAARRKGFTMVLRFAYVEGGDGPYVAPFGDAPLATVLRHIRELTPLLRRNVDVIATLQSGFVGLWGEGYYTDWFSDTVTQEVSDAQWDARRQVVLAELAALPTRTVQLRTPLMKQTIVGTSTGTAGALTPATAYRNTPAARIGHHNDCFLASEDDFGTYLSDPITLDQDYLAADSRFVPVGGETCNPDPPRSEFPNAATQMARFHYSYLNREYNTDVLDSWGAGGIATAERQLGYRFRLLSSTLSCGRTSSVTIRVRNVGWAAPYNARPAQLVLTDGRRRVTLPIDTDVRRWAPGVDTVLRVDLGRVPSGRYRLALALPAAERGTASDPRFAIQTANVGTWDAARGLNDLGQQVVIRGGRH